MPRMCLRFLVTGLLTALVVACGDTSQPAPGSATPADSSTAASARPAEAVRVAFIIKSLTNPFFMEMAKGARLAQQEANLDLQVKTATPETSVEQQIRLVESQIKAGVQGIVISPVDNQRLVPVLKRAQDAGIKIVNIDEQLNPDAVAASGMKPVPYVGVDSERGAYEAARFMARRIQQPTQVAIIEGLPVATGFARKRGAQRAFAENPRLRVVATGVANFKADEAHDLAKTLFKAHPAIGAVYCVNDLMAIGLIKYLQETGRGKVMVGGFDALDEAKDAIRARQMLVTVDQLAARQGYLGVVSVHKLLRGEAVANVTLIDTALVTAASLQ